MPNLDIAQKTAASVRNRRTTKLMRQFTYLSPLKRSFKGRILLKLKGTTVMESSPVGHKLNRVKSSKAFLKR